MIINNFKDMEEVKQGNVTGVCGHGECACGHSCMNMHRFCHRKFCLMRILVVALVLGGVFAAGYCAGSEGRDREGWGHGEGQKGSHMMMRYQNQNEYYGYGGQYQGSESDNSDYGDPQDNVPNINVMYRTRVPLKTITVTTATGTSAK